MRPRQESSPSPAPHGSAPAAPLPVESISVTGNGSLWVFAAIGGLVAVGLYRAQSAEARELDSQVRLQEHLARTSRGGARMSEEALRQLRQMRAEARTGALLGRAA